MAGLSDAPFIQSLAVPSVCCLITFLGYFSQLVFHYSTLDPGPPSQRETVIFNSLLLVLWITYFRAVTVDPGRYVFSERVIEAEDGARWCLKCSAPKPLRAHHCRHCGRCIPKMDHHCPWTKNCVSMTTFPHFFRFLVYANVALWYLGYQLWHRFYALWESRNLPAYLGPSLAGLAAFSLLLLVCFFTSVALGIMLATTLQSFLFNRTMIEGWEVDRHETLADRGGSGKDWWDVAGPNGEKYTFEKLEFPYDIGFFANMAQAMGSRNPLLWLFPLAGNPRIDKSGRGSGWDWEENGFNRIEGLWPPPDPEKLRRAARGWPAATRDYEAEFREASWMSPEQEKEAFRKRQMEDEKRRRKLVAELEEIDDYDDDDDDDNMNERRNQGIPGFGWMNSDGERLRDYGVDEDSQDEDVPIAELLRRRRVVKRDQDL